MAQSVKHPGLFFLKFIYFLERDRERQRDRERESTQAGKEHREAETQNLKQAPGSELSAQSLTQISSSPAVRS